MGLSFGEIIVVVIIAILVAKPHDIKYLLKQIYSLKLLLQRAYHEILSSLDLDNKEADDYNNHTLNLISNTNSDIDKSKVDQMNFYLQKIAEQGETYHGDYNLPSIKKYFIMIKKQSYNKKKDS
ncbi:Uncharacterised protein [Orientia tsutsugamushi]|uniref:Uncharacterized protein n=1 Tax=Orientia tsutsugamushi TaxID=784 RepID=A0A2R8F180_ORITS|nr:DUF2672 domain-containing protein [Orientia tsutsugamushi]SPM45170.1 Uncharacterised protein [Orientia tsutsugamushi]